MVVNEREDEKMELSKRKKSSLAQQSEPEENEPCIRFRATGGLYGPAAGPGIRFGFSDRRLSSVFLQQPVLPPRSPLDLCFSLARLDRHGFSWNFCPSTFEQMALRTWSSSSRWRRRSLSVVPPADQSSVHRAGSHSLPPPLHLLVVCSGRMITTSPPAPPPLHTHP